MGAVVFVNIYQWEVVVKLLVAGGLAASWGACEDDESWF